MSPIHRRFRSNTRVFSAGRVDSHPSQSSPPTEPFGDLIASVSTAATSLKQQKSTKAVAARAKDKQASIAD